MLDEDEIAARFRTLTAREVRLLLLAVDSPVNYRSFADTLGVSRGHVSNTMASIRRKLAVPPKENLARFVARTPVLAVAVAQTQSQPQPVAQEETRRRKDLLRITISELETVATRAERRAHALAALPGTPDDAAQRDEEATQTRRVAELVRQTLKQAFAEVRTTGQPTHAAPNPPKPAARGIA